MARSGPSEIPLAWQRGGNSKALLCCSTWSMSAYAGHPHSVLCYPGEKLAHTLHQRLLVIDTVERRRHPHRVTKKEPLVQGLAPAKGAAGNVPGQAKQLHTVARRQFGYDKIV